MKIDTFDSRSLQPAYHIPGLSPDTPPVVPPDAKSKNAKKKKKANSSLNSGLAPSAVNKSDPAPAANVSSEVETSAPADPAKKLRNLKKKLRDIEQLEKRLGTGEIK